MSEMFDKWDSEIDTKALAADVKAAKNNSGEYEEPPHDTYEVKVTYMGIGATKKDQKPMAKVAFEIVSGELAERRIYMNQVFDPTSKYIGFTIHRFNEFLKSMKTSIPVEFTTFGEYNQTMLDIKGECDDRLLMFQLNFAPDKKNPKFSTFTIEDVFENVPM